VVEVELPAGRSDPVPLDSDAEGSLGIEAAGVRDFVSALLRYATDAISISDRRSGRFELVSDSFCRLTRYARPELIGRTAVEVGLIADDAIRTDTIRRSDQGVEGPSEIRWCRRDGSARLLEATAQPLAGGRLNLVISRDITERRSLEESLRASEQRFRGAVESMLDAFTIISPVHDGVGQIVDFRYEYANDAYCGLVACDRERLIGTTVGGLFPAFAGSARGAVYRRVAETGEAFRTEELRTGDAWAGTTIADRVLDTMVVAVDGNLVISARDVTERRAVEAQLRASEQRFRVAVESLIDAFTIISPVRDERGQIVDFRWRYVNAAYCALLGCERDELAGRRGSELFPDFPDGDPFAVYRRVATTGQPEQSETVLPATIRNGSPVPARVIQNNVVALGDNVVVAGRDVTDSREAERHIRQLNQSLAHQASELQAANRELEGFTYSVAHDLRGPLRAVAGFTDLLGRGGHIAPDDHVGHALVKRTTAAAARMGELIDALLELAQLSRRQLAIAHVNLTATAGEVADELRASGATQRDVTFAIEEHLEADADPRLARILLHCLLENAWKFTSGRTRARIEVARAGSGVFVVRDNGAGFDMEFADQLFKPFGRLHRQDEFPGTGVGLATAERIVRRHGGTLRGEGRVDQGATFFFTLEPD
jgi:PAS domain S-box-containing protein